MEDGMRRTKAVLHVALDDNDKVRASLTTNGAPATKMQGMEWNEVVRLLDHVKPLSEHHRDLAVRRDGDRHLQSVKALSQTGLGSFLHGHPGIQQMLNPSTPPVDLTAQAPDNHPKLEWPSAAEAARRLAGTVPEHDKARRLRIQRLRLGTPPARFLAALLSWWRPI